MLDWLELLDFQEVKKGIHVRGGVTLCPDGIVGTEFIDNSASREQVEVVNECLGRKSSHKAQAILLPKALKLPQLKEFQLHPPPTRLPPPPPPPYPQPQQPRPLPQPQPPPLLLLPQPSLLQRE